MKLLTTRVQLDLKLTFPDEITSDCKTGNMNKHASFVPALTDDKPFEPKVATLRQEKVEDYYDIKEQLGK